MKRVDWRILVGSVLILGGLTSLLGKLGVIPEGMDLFWGLIGTVAGLTFLYVFFSNLTSRWWAAIPGFILVGIGVAALLPDKVDEWSNTIILGSLSLAFWAIYLVNRQFWWTIIPGGVLLALAATAGLSNILSGADTGSIFFLGLGLTFLLVALLARQSWGYIPAVVLLLLAAALGLNFGNLLAYFWIATLFLVGLALILFAIRRK